MGQTLEIKMAKASKDDFERLTNFMHLCEEFFEYGTHTPVNEEIEE